MKGMQWPFGYREREVTNTPGGKAKQRPRATEENTK